MAGQRLQGADATGREQEPTDPDTGQVTGGWKMTTWYINECRHRTGGQGSDHLTPLPSGLSATSPPPMLSLLQ